MFLLRRAYWRDVTIAVRRGRFDQRARARLFKTAAFFLLAGMGLALIWLFLDGNPENSTILIALLPALAAGSWFITRGTREDPVTLPIPPAIKQYLEDRTVIIAALLSRSGSEIYFESHQLPGGQEIITRQILNGKLRDLGLWDKLDPAESAVMSAPDQTWSREQKQQSIAWCEQLRLLRWTLRIDSEVMGLQHAPQIDFSIARQLLEMKLPLSSTRYDRPVVLASWDLRAERDKSDFYAARLFAESCSRNLMELVPRIDGLDSLRESNLGPSKDLLVGSKTVEQIDDSEVVRMTLTAWRRGQYAAYLTDVLSNAAARPFADWEAAIEKSRATVEATHT
jgi:hypothetical protein